MHKDLKPENVMMASPRKAPLEAARSRLWPWV